MQISTLPSASVGDKMDNTVLKMENFMLKDTTILAFTSIWETASMVSTVSFHIPLKDKLSNQNLPKMFAVNYITRTIVPKVANASFPTILETNHAFSTLWESVNLQMGNVDFLTKRKWK